MIKIYERIFFLIIIFFLLVFIVFRFIGNDIILSNNRAKSIKSYLVNNGILESRIKCVGYGEKQPITNNSTKEGREKNRRIEIRILK